MRPVVMNTNFNENVVFSLCLFLVFINTCYVCGINGINCSLQDGYTCERYNFSGKNCTPDYLTSMFPEDFYQTNSTKYPGQPGNISLTVEYKLYKGQNYPQVILSFTTPKDVDKNYLKGFEVSRNDIVNTGRSDEKCYIYSLSTWNNSFDEMKMIFNLTLFPIKPGTSHMQFDVYTLPKYIKRGESDLYRSIAVEIPAYSNSESTDVENWKATIFIVKQELQQSIVVFIISPPEIFGLTQMEYSLVDNATKDIVATQSLSVTENSCTFQNVSSGTYKIWVKPLNPPGSYITTETWPIVFNATIPVPSTAMTKLTTKNVPRVSTEGTETHTAILTITKEPQSSINLNVAWIIVGVIVGVSMIGGICAFVCHRRWRYCKEAPITHFVKNNGSDNPNFIEAGVETLSINNKPDNLPLKNRPKLFLLYEEDHKYHRKVVEKFAIYLQQYCHCDVMCVEWQLDDSWVHQDLEQADYVIIVNSEGASYTYFSHGNKNMPNFQQQSPPPTSKDPSSINSIKNKFIHEEKYDNIVMIYFEYTDEKFMLPDIPGYKYQIPKHLTDFLLHIHKLHRTNNLAQYDLPLDGNHNWTPDGQEFLTALAEASQYQRDNPHWAIKKYGFYRCLSCNDSQHDSGLPDEFKSPSLKKEINDYKFQILMDHLDTTSQGAITINSSNITCWLDGFLGLPNEHTILPKQRLMRSSQSFNQINGKVTNSQSIQSGDIDLCEINFIPPDDPDDFDTVSKSQSDWLKSFVDHYQVLQDQKAQELDSKQQNETAPVKGYNRNDDLMLLKVHSGEVPFIATDLVSLGGESI